MLGPGDRSENKMAVISVLTALQLKVNRQLWPRVINNARKRNTGTRRP